MARTISPLRRLLEEFDIDPRDPEIYRKLCEELARKYHPDFRNKRGRGRPAKTEFDRLAEMTFKEMDLVDRIDELKQQYEAKPSEFKDVDRIGALERALAKVAEESGWTHDKLDKLYYPRRPRKSRRKNTE